MKTKESIAGMSLGGGRKENFFFCLLEHFEQENRWFLTSLKQVKDEEKLDRDEVITDWVDSAGLKQLMVDFPLTKPMCEECDLECPGTLNCHHPVVQRVREQMQELIQVDSQKMHNNPKRYEQERVSDNMVNYSQCVMEKETSAHILSKSFKRRLKKGFTPYWNRPVDFWVWKNYYDQLLKFFNISFDSFGNVSVMLIHRFQYLLKHLPKELSLFESNVNIILLELYRAKVIAKKDILELDDLHMAPLARIRITKAIEDKLRVFIYAKDLEMIAKHPKAFDSFLLAIAGQRLILKQTREIEVYGESSPPDFIVPEFC